MSKFIFALTILFFLSLVCSARTQESQKIEHTEKLTLLKQPKAKYTKEVRKNNIEGENRLQITFQANAEIGNVKIISGLGYGLDEQAVLAANHIKFIPEKKDGASVSIIKTVIYVFNLK